MKFSFGLDACLVQSYKKYQVPNPVKRAGGVHFYELVTGASPGGIGRFVKISEP